MRPEARSAAAPEAPATAAIFGAFLKLGLTAFGGPAIIPHIRELAVARHKWLDGESFKEGVVLSQSIPGATAMQVAAYVGLKSRGVRGAAAAFIGLGFPAFILMLLLSEFYRGARTAAPVVALFSGLQVVVVALVAQAAYSFGKDLVKDVRCSLISVISAAVLLLNGDPFLLIVGCALAGVLIFRDVAPSSPPDGISRSGNGAVTAAAIALCAVGLLLLKLGNPPLCSLSLLMMRINLFAFGGGLSALPLMHHEMVSRGWMESRAFLDGIALGQVTPGPISITGTFIGYLLFGPGGAAVTTIATFLPSFLLLIFSEPYMQKLKGSRFFASASRGIISCFLGLLFYAAYRFASEISWDWARALLAMAAFAALLRKVDVLVVVLVGSLFALALLR
ncbi:chromate efflux transporter [Geomonas sp.]|uniref:chromate efflux transporter n=1 Tax=Geomonas sp. TaxID=2651584 RepID=UPI002B47195A|nr:chromate efflux transporter [Geomonas sp.]HJV33450.1 chromate efflux transporter [Geomonas sp.]